MKSFGHFLKPFQDKFSKNFISLSSSSFSGPISTNSTRLTRQTYNKYFPKKMLSTTSSSSSSSLQKEAIGKNVDKAREILKSANAVCFDVDSTVVTEEGIDVLADHCGAGEAVAEWTAKAMGGSVPFHEALEARLALFNPSLKDIADCNIKHPLVLSSGMRELAEKLEKRGTHVYLVSGGFRQMIHPLAEILGIPLERVYANNLLFKEDGTYKGFDANEPTSRAGGKGKVVGDLKNKYGYKTVVMIGDGATDMEARPPADIFIGYGGVAVREVVKHGSDWFVTDMKDLIEALD